MPSASMSPQLVSRRPVPDVAPTCLYSTWSPRSWVLDATCSNDNLYPDSVFPCRGRQEADPGSNVMASFRQKIFEMSKIRIRLLFFLAWHGWLLFSPPKSEIEYRSYSEHHRWLITASNTRKLRESRPYRRQKRQKPRRWLFSAGNPPISGVWNARFDHPELGHLQVLQNRAGLL